MRSKIVVLIMGLVFLGICAENSTCLGKMVSTQLSPLSPYAGPNSIVPTELLAGPEFTRSAELTVRNGSEAIPPRTLSSGMALKPFRQEQSHSRMALKPFHQEQSPSGMALKPFHQERFPSGMDLKHSAKNDLPQGWI